MMSPRSWFRQPRLLVTMVLVPIVALVVFLSAPRSSGDERPAARLVLKAGDHISIIGNTLADRMQHDGWTEAYLHGRFPRHDLVFRNLGFAGDELNLRLRSANFG